MTYAYITCPRGQDPAAFTRWVLDLVPGDHVQRSTGSQEYVLEVGTATYAAWKATLPGMPAPAALPPNESAGQEDGPSDEEDAATSEEDGPSGQEEASADAAQEAPKTTTAKRARKRGSN